MANDWISDEPKSDWLDKKPEAASPLKTLKDIGTERQVDSETPKVDPIPTPAPPPEPVEVIPYDRVAKELENASSDALASFSRLSRASVNLKKISIIVTGNGPKGKELISKAEMYRGRVDSLCAEIKKLSEEVAEYKNTLPIDTTPQA